MPRNVCREEYILAKAVKIKNFSPGRASRVAQIFITKIIYLQERKIRKPDWISENNHRTKKHLIFEY